MSTQTMLMDALIDAVEDEGIKQHYRNTFIHHPVTGAKFRVLGSNEAFFRDLLEVSKISHPNLYLASSLSAVKAVAAACADNARFSKSRLVARSRSLSDLVVKHWPIR